jgi:tetratricopeptide (TPR) repeat protein
LIRFGTAAAPSDTVAQKIAAEKIPIARLPMSGSIVSHINPHRSPRQKNARPQPDLGYDSGWKMTARGSFARQLAAIVLLAVPAGTARAQQLPGARAAFEEGQALLAQKRNTDAAEKLRLVTMLEPGFAPAWFALALAERRAGRCPQAIPAYRRYAEMQPAEAEPHYGLGLCLRDTGDAPGALAALKKYVALERRPTAAKWVDNARAIVAQLEPAPAAPTAAHALPPAPAPPPPAAPPPAPTPAPAPTAAKPAAASPAAALYAEAQRLRDSGQIEAALKKFDETAAADPDLMPARAAWGELLIKIRRDREAIAVFRAALARNAQYPLIWYELAFSLRQMGQLPEAVHAYRRYIQLRPDDPDPYYSLGRTLDVLGRRDEALRAYEAYLAMERRPGEARWVAAAQASIAALNLKGAAPPAARASAPPLGGAPAPPR